MVQKRCEGGPRILGPQFGHDEIRRIHIDLTVAAAVALQELANVKRAAALARDLGEREVDVGCVARETNFIMQEVATMLGKVFVRPPRLETSEHTVLDDERFRRGNEIFVEAFC